MQRTEDEYMAVVERAEKAERELEALLDAVGEYIYAYDDWRHDAEADESGEAESTPQLDSAESALRGLLDGKGGATQTGGPKTARARWREMPDDLRAVVSESLDVESESEDCTDAFQTARRVLFDGKGE